jgi:hypothetical protein
VLSPSEEKLGTKVPKKAEKEALKERSKQTRRRQIDRIPPGGRGDDRGGSRCARGEGAVARRRTPP